MVDDNLRSSALVTKWRLGLAAKAIPFRPSAMQQSDTAAILQMIFWLFAAVGGAFAIWKHFAESRERRLWEKAKLAKQMLDDLDANDKALDATYMLGGFNGRRYARPGAQDTDAFEITQEQIRAVLDPCRDPCSLNEAYVRDCFDNLLFHIELCASAADRGLIEWDDMQPLLATLFAGAEYETFGPCIEYAKSLRYMQAAGKLSSLREVAVRRPARSG